MFTVFAIILLIIGLPLFNWSGRKLEDFRWYNTLGGYALMVSCILWACVFTGLLWRLLEWSWYNMP